MTRLRQATGAVAGGIRTLQRLTLGPDDQLTGPADVREVIASLSLAMSYVPQLLENLAVYLEVEQVKGTVCSGRGDSVAENVRAISDTLHRAGLDAEAMAAALDTAQEACGQVLPADPAQGKQAQK
jgi:energy-coupling factor transporter transmembrane protein EcfT